MDLHGVNVRSLSFAIWISCPLTVGLSPSLLTVENKNVFLKSGGLKGLSGSYILIGLIQSPTNSNFLLNVDLKVSENTVGDGLYMVIAEQDGAASL